MERTYATLDELLTTLSQSMEETLTYFDLPADDLAKTYAPGKWTVRQLLHHLADTETVLYERIRRGIARPGQVVWGYDQDAWAREFNYAEQELSLNQAVYLAVRQAVMGLATTHYEKAGEQRYVHSETGLRTVREEFAKVAWHNEHHLQQIRVALAQ